MRSTSSALTRRPVISGRSAATRAASCSRCCPSSPSPFPADPMSASSVGKFAARTRSTSSCVWPPGTRSSFSFLPSCSSADPMSESYAVMVPCPVLAYQQARFHQKVLVASDAHAANALSPGQASATMDAPRGSAPRRPDDRHPASRRRARPSTSAASRRGSRSRRVLTVARLCTSRAERPSRSRA